MPVPKPTKPKPPKRLERAKTMLLFTKPPQRPCPTGKAVCNCNPKMKGPPQPFLKVPKH